MPVMKQINRGAALVLLACCTTAQADYTLSVTGRLGSEGGEIGQVRTPAVNNLIQTPDAGSADGTLWLRYHDNQGHAFQAQGGRFPLACLRDGTVSQDDVCQRGIKISLPPGVMAVAPEAGGETLLSVSVQPSGQGSTTSATGSAAGQPVWQDGVGYHLQAGSAPLVPAPGVSVSGQVTAWAGPDLVPGTYTGAVEVAGYADGNRVLGRETVRYTVTVLPTLPVCTLQVPASVNFGWILSQNAGPQLAQAGTTVAGECSTANPADAGLGIYLTFAAGTHGVYNGDNRKLATSADNLYITGGTPDSPPGCEAAPMQFDSQAHPEFQTRVMENGRTIFSQPLTFSLCHDPATPLVAGQVSSDAYVNVVVQ